MQLWPDCMQASPFAEAVSSFEQVKPEIRILNKSLSGLRSELESSSCLSDGSASVDTPDITSDLDQCQDDRNSSDSSGNSVSFDSSRPVIIFDWDDTMYVLVIAPVLLPF